MSGFPSVARVLLVALEARAAELAPSLRVIGEPARYELECVAPSRAHPSPDPTWSVLVLDGPSIAEDDREPLLRRMSGQPFSTLLYIPNRLPSESEVQQAFAWTNGTIEQGWNFGDRLRRHVQNIALAPWRRAMALRAEAERLGDRRLRVVRFADVDASEERSEPGSEPTARVRRLDRAMPFVLAEQAWKLGAPVPSLVASAFHEGRRVGVASARESAESLSDMLLHELSRSLDAVPPDLVCEIEAPYRAASGSPILAARYGGAAWAIGVMRDELRRLMRAELAAIERHEVRSGHEP